MPYKPPPEQSSGELKAVYNDPAITDLTYVEVIPQIFQGICLICQQPNMLLCYPQPVCLDCNITIGMQDSKHGETCKGEVALGRYYLTSMFDTQSNKGC